ncbi:MAG: hypothetical protein PHN72_06795 [Bacilli bacterium]|nr:hypothetical protein [Bacilli bacterium]
MKKEFILRILLTILLGAILYYIMLPPMNISSPDFWIFAFIILAIYIGSSILGLLNIQDNVIRFGKVPKKKMIGVAIIGSVFAIILVINLFHTPFLSAKSYAKRIVIDETGDFNKDIEEVDFNALPLLDKDSSQKLGDRVMGQMPELVSQFSVSDLYTQINYKNDIVRVTPLEYASVIKYFTNKAEGIKGYITVNSVTGETKLTKLKEGMKYAPSALFNDNLYRKLRFAHPTEIFEQARFELDNDGTPYWIVPTVKYAGVGLKKEITGIVMLDPVTGKTKKYAVKDVPTWVDHVYSPELVMEQIDDWGQYKKGFINSIFGQKDVVLSTSGYNYTVMNDDVYLYTGITSAAADQATIGFVMSNLRTKETKFYAVPGAEEQSAMASAKGQVQQMKYNSTFPLLINLNGKPTYLVSLKDNAGLVKMYGFVDVADYQKVVVTDASKGIETAANNYLGDDKVHENDSQKTKEIKISSIATTNIDGNTYYYIKDQEGMKYRASIKTNTDGLPYLKENDTITIRFKTEKEVTELIGISK